MSPEQADLVNQDIDTCSDIYSLGVLLYELLAGTLPFDREALRKAAFGEIQRIIREEEPPRPSTKLSSLSDEATEIVQNRQTELPSLIKRLYKELEWIPLKAMRKERGNRYQSASEFADDIRNYLDGNPLIAGPESVAYRVKKFARKHTGPIVSVVGILVVLIAGLVVSTTMYFQVKQAKIVAELKTEDATMAEQVAREAEQDAKEQRQLALEAAELAKDRELIVRKQLYITKIGLAQQAWESGNILEVLGLLNSLQPEHRQEDLRGFEWYYLWKLCHSQHITLYGHRYFVRSVSFSPCGKVLATGGGDEVIRLWDVDTCRIKASLQGHTKTVSSLAFSQDGKVLASGSWDRTIRLWDVANRQQRFSFKGGNLVSSVAFSPNGDTLAAGLLDGRVRIWRIDSSPHLIAVKKLYPPSEVFLSFSPDGKTLAIGGGEVRKPSEVKLWDIATGQVTALSGHMSTIRSVVFSHDGRLLATASHDATVRLWDPHSYEAVAVGKGHTAPLWCAAFSPDGKTLATGSTDKTIRVWDVENLAEVHRLRGHTHNVSALSFSPDGKILASASRDGTIKLWDPDNPRETGTRLIHESSVCSVAFSPDDKLLVTACESGNAVLWDPVTGQQLNVLKGHTGPIWSVAISFDGKRIATGSGDRTVRLWDTSSGDTLATFPGHTADVYFVAFSPDDETLAVGCEDMSLILWDLDRKEKRTIEKGQRRPVSHPRPALHGVFSPDGKILATGSCDRKSRLWDVSTGQEYSSLSGHKDGIWSVAFSSNGTIFATASEDMTLKLWEMSKPQVSAVTLAGHAGPVLCVAFSPDDKIVASGSDDRTVRLWDVDLGTQRFVLTGHQGPITSLAFSSDGNILATASEDRSVILWRAAMPKEVEEHPGAARSLIRKANESEKRGDP
jgi:WD40 repeat protein